ncbi:prolyl-tRNA editing enzyme YbaK/EbsC (Cys-tRNA(Pro) deacylase) [Streptosporangium becharense]|uniref:Prolyl-tRNA editing enzyme YbaK/EbsC (Cys-tRNA(Pro) deacylase) n=1 Tax=Streptosporangium becharense TaxID=1816182 RepID=A0A7W9IIP5_9ACTN|nr:YbaK/EbsC family protein [Streptosporangium becharense]MBB2913920.1 prolyl-tRNA editing enzyme YbaK/EbsC (Cys-tRNA(Pro) deacylase) [Streptosporangium becharense]MBB5821418.1 prolyl-tRNA editing enzyme YbaK/EbsC (Cys-tRNA(Pro) deacylase) [Streptosporangium becharense]
MAIGTLDWVEAGGRPDLLAAPVARAVAGLDGVEVAEIDPGLADTAAFCERYGVAMGESANCVIVAAKRAGEVGYAACLVLATMRADVNGIVRRHLGARKISFAPQDDAVGLTGMEYGGITPLGLPEEWPVLVDEAVAAHPGVVIGSGVRRSKLAVPGSLLAGLKTAQVLRLAN